MTDRRPQSESELVDFVRSIDVRAPDSLHEKVQALVSERTSSRGGRSRLPARTAPALLGAAALAAVAIALVLALAGGGGSAPSLHQATALALSSARARAPVQSRHDEADLTASVDGVAFPYLEDRFGWRSTGMRIDRIGGRTVATVFYADGRGRQIGYAIVGGLPAPATSGGVTEWSGQTAFRVSSQEGATVVSWLRDRHLCVLAGRGVQPATLIALASWTDHGSVS